MSEEFSIPQRAYFKVRGMLSNWTFRARVIDRSAAGETIKFYVGDRFGEGWYSPQHDHWPELDWIKKYGIQPGDVVIDCGANHGFTSVLFARWAGAKGRVHAVEPLPHNVEIIRKNLEINGIQNVEIHPVAGASKEGVVTITAEPNSNVVTTSMPSKRKKTVNVRTQTLDNLLPEVRVNFLKIDVEAFEAEVLRGAPRILATRPRLDLELHVMLYPDRCAGLAEVFSLIEPAFYIIEIQTEVDGVVRPFDPKKDSPEFLSQYDMIHLFCR